jgi:hypothetical protein
VDDHRCEVARKRRTTGGSEHIYVHNSADGSHNDPDGRATYDASVDYYDDFATDHDNDHLSSDDDDFHYDHVDAFHNDLDHRRVGRQSRLPVVELVRLLRVDGDWRRYAGGCELDRANGELQRDADRVKLCLDWS